MRDYVLGKGAMKFLLVLLFIFSLLAGCLPQQVAPRVTGQNLQDSGVSENTQDVPTDQKEDLVSKAKWFNKGEYTTVQTVDLANKQNAYLRGGVINAFLKDELNYKSNFCAVFDFEPAPGKDIKQLRAKLIPNQYTDYKTGTNIRYFRLNIISDAGNEICDVNEAKRNSLTQSYDIVSRPVDLVTSTNQVCLNCINFVTSESIKIFKIINFNGQSLIEKVANNDIDMSALTFRIDMNNITITQDATCSDAKCKSLGFDCCNSGQCVNEKSQKLSGISSDPTGFQLAELEKFTNPNWYLKYPQFYFSCLENPTIPQDELIPEVDPTDPDGDADVRLSELIEDYYCIKELEQNSLATPFHTDPINTSKTYNKCSLNSTNNMFYETVMKRMYNKCGCVETEFNNMVANCPSYSYRAILLVDNNNIETDTIENIECLSPQVDIGEVPFQDLQVYLNSKSAPHRFFNNENVELNFEERLDENVSTTQEGTEFLYLDQDGEKINPINGSFNMNSILGSMNVNLSFARPAKVIKILPNTIYQIAVMSGNYSPCPSCAKDSWFSNFSAHPSTNNGLGLQAVGGTTERNNWGTNITLGNYEDTIFGRACWLPPTMIPYTHNENANLQTQRLNRLKTQAALFVNGYQRDWFGFNKGAIIGSFDGVSWFAIGKSRLIESNSNRLYLAINAPFADLAVANDHLLNIHQWVSDSTGTFFDFDPNHDIVSPFQNEAGQCQSYHICENDADCITTLGWEYSCVDTTILKTKWPSFTQLGANELEDTSITRSIQGILANPEAPSGPTKRCVYRGAGAPCRKDYENITGLNLRKSLTCAPNFYCAGVNTSGVFNREVARFAAPLESLIEARNHYFGQDADILGRPKDYVNNGNLYEFDSDIKNALIANVSTQDGSISDANVGVCRPGKLLPSSANGIDTIDTTPQEQHKDFDPQNRTDYINQIAGCNSALYTAMRYSSCPMLDDNGNYLHTSSDFINGTFSSTRNLLNASIPLSTEQAIQIYSTFQNSCGLESLKSDATINASTTASDIKDKSPFKFIEGDELLTGSVKIEPTLTRDACFRKAGSVCHTDLDCSPNKLMAQQIDLFGDDFFGNLAEKKYYEEYLICGQGETEPFPGEDGADEFSVKNNRCCREIGKTLTIYTPNTPGVDESTGLELESWGGFEPNNPNRYSRFSSIETDFSSSDALFELPTLSKSDGSDIDSNPDIFKQYQWQSIGRVASKTCCGGGYIRKFADGSNNWQINRLAFDPVNFKCLNTNSPLVTTTEPEAYGTTNSLLSFDRRTSMCLDTDRQQGGCAIIGIDGSNDPGNTTAPVLLTSDKDQFLFTEPQEASDVDAWTEFSFAFSIPSSHDTNEFTFLNWSLTPDDTNVRRNVTIYVPSWVSYKNDFDTEVGVFLERPQGRTVQCNKSASTAILGPQEYYSAASCPAPGGNTNDIYCCYEYNETTRTLGIAYSDETTFPFTNPDPGIDPEDPEYAYEKNNLSAILRFKAPGTHLWEKTHANNANLTLDIEHRRGSVPGDMNYYLERLSRLELVGIPQITYLPIYCNNNYQKLVPGIFKDNEATNVHEFISNASTLENENVSKPWNTDSSTDVNANSLNTRHVATEDILEISPIFSSSEFMCCKKLGNVTDDITKCCSGYGVAVDGDDQSGKSICALPSGTDLNVYFNRFVSNEGYKEVGNDSDANDNFLVVSDYDGETGEPLQNTNVLIKLKNLGEQFCETNAVVRGGAFGRFPAEINGRGAATGDDVFNITDSNFDQAQTTQGEDRGFLPFSTGLRWNHHFYCAF